MLSHDNLTNHSPDIPPSFDPRRFPIIAEHFFGVAVLFFPDGSEANRTIDIAAEIGEAT